MNNVTTDAQGKIIHITRVKKAVLERKLSNNAACLNFEVTAPVPLNIKRKKVLKSIDKHCVDNHKKSEKTPISQLEIAFANTAEPLVS